MFPKTPHGNPVSPQLPLVTPVAAPIAEDFPFPELGVGVWNVPVDRTAVEETPVHEEGQRERGHENVRTAQ